MRILRRLKILRLLEIRLPTAIHRSPIRNRILPVPTPRPPIQEIRREMLVDIRRDIQQGIQEMLREMLEDIQQDIHRAIPQELRQSFGECRKTPI